MVWPKRTPPKSPASGPFGLRGIALFLLAASVYLSMLASVAALFKGHAADPWPRLLVAFLAILTWAILLPVYRYWDVKIGLRIHWIGPAIVLFLMLVPLLLLRLNLVLNVIAFACGASTLVSFPATVVLLLANARKRPRPSKTCP